MFGADLLVVLNPDGNDNESGSGEESPNKVDCFTEAGRSSGFRLLLFGLFQWPIIGGRVLVEKRAAFVRL